METEQSVDHSDLSPSLLSWPVDNESSPGAQRNLASRPLLGISACLMGDNVRYNGGHKRSRYCAEVLSRYFEFRSVCPEVAIGLAVPRPTIRTVESSGTIKVIASDNPELDYTQKLRQLADSLHPKVQLLSGFIFMQKSPSCGVGSSKLYNEKNHPATKTDGVFASAVMAAFPLLPVTEAGQLNDAGIRENFILQVYAYHQWRYGVMEHLSKAALQSFHHRFKWHLNTHNSAVARELGQLLAKCTDSSLESVSEQYISKFMLAMKKPVTRKRQARHLIEWLRYLKKMLNPKETTELRALIEHYREGIVPLIVPMTLVRFLVKKYGSDADLALLEPYPFDLGLQNGI